MVFLDLVSLLTFGSERNRDEIAAFCLNLIGQSAQLKSPVNPGLQKKCFCAGNFLVCVSDSEFGELTGSIYGQMKMFQHIVSTVERIL